MSGVLHLGITDAAEIIERHAADVVDIRDPASFAAGHIAGARHLTNSNLGEFLARTDRARPPIVCCYHGHSSIGAAQFLLEQGFTTVYSLDGGIEGWRFNYPLVTAGA